MRTSAGWDSCASGRVARVASALACAAFGLLASACTPVVTEPVRGPDGTQWVSMTCAGGMQDCWREAGEECPQGYVVADSATLTTAGALYDSTTAQMLFQCRDPAARPDGPRPQAAFAGPAPAVDPLTCLRAYESFDETAARWVATHADRSAARTPSPTEFLKVCSELPADAQECLAAPFRQTHEDRCELTLAGLDRRTRRRVDALFLTPEDREASP